MIFLLNNCPVICVFLKKIQIPLFINSSDSNLFFLSIFIIQYIFSSVLIFNFLILNSVNIFY